MSGEQFCHFFVNFRTPVAIELPDVPDFGDLFEIKVGHKEFVLVAARLGDYLSARVAEVTLSVELPDVPGGLGSDPVDRPDEIPVCHRVRRLLELPEILREGCDPCRRVQKDLGAMEPEDPRPFREVPVIANVHADIGIGGLENGGSQVSRLEVEFFPESRFDLGDMSLAVLSEVLAVRVAL